MAKANGSGSLKRLPDGRVVVSVRHAGMLLNVDKNTVRRWCDAGTLDRVRDDDDPDRVWIDLASVKRRLRAERVAFARLRSWAGAYSATHLKNALTQAEVGRLLGLNPSTVWRNIQTGVLVRAPAGGDSRRGAITSESVRRYIRERLDREGQNDPAIDELLRGDPRAIVRLEGSRDLLEAMDPEPEPHQS